MDMILATPDGREICVIPYDFDFELGGTNDFEVTLQYASWIDDIKIGCLVYVPDTEYGGIIKKISSSTATGNISLSGYTWRGYLAHRIISPPAGSDYYTANGELNTVIRALVNIPMFVVTDESTGINVNYRFNRYVDMAEGLEVMCESVGYRLDIQYKQTVSGGYVLVSAAKAGRYGDSIEYSQDSMIDFSSVNDDMGVNHLICLGTGELKNRIVRHLYADTNGNISQTQTITGIDEIVEVFENTGAEAATLIETGTNRLKELVSKKSFTPSLKEVEQELYIGDIVTGQDYITGNRVTKPITTKLIKRNNGDISTEYKIEGKS